MKASSCVVILSLLFLLCSVSLAALQNTFLQCLHNYSTYPISAAIYTPNRSNASFSYVLQSYARNLRFASAPIPKPLVIVTARHESHVQATIACCKSHGLLMKIRSGGHDDEGLSYVSEVPFVILDMFNIRSIRIDLKDESMWVESGATLGEIYYSIAKKSNTLGFPAGVCPTVGAGGHFSGGGYGNLMRKYGLSIDNIVDAQIVDVEGRVLNRKSMGEDLFWAIRGGGGASFGVILSWKIKLVWVPDIVTVFRVNRTLEQGATNLVYKWQQVASKLSEDLFIRLELRSQNQTIGVSFVALFLGKAKDLISLMNESFAELGLQQSDCVEMSWIESVLYWYNIPEGTSTDVLLNRLSHQIFFKYKADYVKEPISKMGLESLWQKMIQLDKAFMMWNPYGGRMSEISETETAYPHRAGYIFKLHYLAHWTSMKFSDHRINLVRELYDFMTPYVTKFPRQAFLNYRDIDIGSSPHCNATYEEAKVYGTMYFKGNFDRLVQVKTEVDPCNFFRNEQSIPPLATQRSFACGRVLLVDEVDTSFDSSTQVTPDQRLNMSTAIKGNSETQGVGAHAMYVQKRKRLEEFNRKITDCRCD